MKLPWQGDQLAWQTNTSALQLQLGSCLMMETAAASCRLSAFDGVLACSQSSAMSKIVGETAPLPVRLAGRVGSGDAGSPVMLAPRLPARLPVRLMVRARRDCGPSSAPPSAPARGEAGGEPLAALCCSHNTVVDSVAPSTGDCLAR